MAVPWNPDEMTLDQARAEYDRVRKIVKPSTADLRRESALARRVRTLEASDHYLDRIRTAETAQDVHRASRAYSIALREVDR